MNAGAPVSEVIWFETCRNTCPAVSDSNDFHDCD